VSSGIGHGREKKVRGSGGAPARMKLKSSREIRPYQRNIARQTNGVGMSKGASKRDMKNCHARTDRKVFAPRAFFKIFRHSGRVVREIAVRSALSLLKQIPPLVSSDPINFQDSSDVSSDIVRISRRADSVCLVFNTLYHSTISYSSQTCTFLYLFFMAHS